MIDQSTLFKLLEKTDGNLREGNKLELIECLIEDEEFTRFLVSMTEVCCKWFFRHYYGDVVPSKDILRRVAVFFGEGVSYPRDTEAKICKCVNVHQNDCIYDHMDDLCIEVGSLFRKGVSYEVR